MCLCKWSFCRKLNVSGTQEQQQIGKPSGVPEARKQVVPNSKGHDCSAVTRTNSQCSTKLLVCKEQLGREWGQRSELDAAERHPRKGCARTLQRSPVVLMGYNHSFPSPSLVSLAKSQAGFTACADVSAAAVRQIVSEVTHLCPSAA